MIVIDSAERTEAEFAAAILLAGQLAAAGHRVAVDEAGMPHPVGAALVYEAAPFLTEIAGDEITRVLLLASGPVKPPTLSTLRSYRLPPGVGVTVLGRFATRQSELDALLPVAYAVGRDPELVNLAEWQRRPLGTAGIVPIAGFPVAPRAGESPNSTRLTVVLGPDTLADPAAVQALTVLAYQRQIRLCLVVPADQKARLGSAAFGTVLIVGQSEVLPAALVAQSDIIVVFDLAFAALRIATLCTDALQSGVIVVDCTARGDIVSAGAPAVRGPDIPGALWPYLAGR